MDGRRSRRGSRGRNKREAEGQEQPAAAAANEPWIPPMAAAARGGAASRRASAQRSSDDPARSGSSRSRKKAPPENSSGRKRRRKKSASGDDPAELYADEPALASLLERLRDHYSQEDPAGDGANEIPLNVTMARYLLEASSGNIELAASLYSEGAALEAQEAALAAAGYDPADEEDEATAEADNDDVSGARQDGEAPPAGPPNEEERRVRRRLDRQFEAVNQGANGQQEDEQEPQDGQDPNNDEDDAPEAVAVPNLDAAEVAPDDADHGESVSISDDEAANGCRMKLSRRRRNNSDDEDAVIRGGANEERRSQRIDQGGQRHVQRHLQEGERVRRFVSDSADAQEGSKQAASTRAKRDASHDDDLSENEWVFEEDIASLQKPETLLWGKQANAGESNANDVVNEENSASSSQVGIPSTWLHAGFSMSPCGTGLVTKNPPQEEVALIRWRQSRAGASKSPQFAPYYCRGVTAILSAVTALMYTGASIQGAQVDCNADRRPFAELSQEERLREFDSRLTDALSSLIFIAAKASMNRKKRVIDKRKQGDGDCRSMTEQTIERRLHLCPTSVWDEDTATDDGHPPEGADAGKRMQIATSLSSIYDIRSYVRSNLRSFMGRGGVALFLETILRIHGKSCVESMIRRSRKKLGLPQNNKSLVSCDCVERWKAQPPPSPAIRSKAKFIDTSPLRHECIGIELFSLVLTGQVYSELKGWSTNALQVGLLSGQRGEIGRALEETGRNVWILRGETSYSVLWVNPPKDNSGVVSDLDKPGVTFQVTHWNCWYGQRHRTGMRVNTARGAWVAPTQRKLSSSPLRQTVSDSILLRRRQKSILVASSGENEPRAEDTESIITKDEIDRVRVNSEDAKFYPKEYQRWRFDLGSHAETADNWIPYFRLKDRQKLVVEMKLAPQINRILWTRWPKATIDAFTPSGGPAPVV